MKTFAINDTHEELLRLIDRAARGERVIFTKNNEPIAELFAIQQPLGRPALGSVQQDSHGGDFDASVDIIDK